jgi:hypothetical protein
MQEGLSGSPARECQAICKKRRSPPYGDQEITHVRGQCLRLQFSSGRIGSIACAQFGCRTIGMCRILYWYQVSVNPFFML